MTHRGGSCNSQFDFTHDNRSAMFNVPRPADAFMLAAHVLLLFVKSIINESNVFFVVVCSQVIYKCDLCTGHLSLSTTNLTVIYSVV